MNLDEALRQEDAAAQRRIDADERAAKEAHAIVCRLAADPSIDPLLANVLARQFGKQKSRKFDESATPSAFGELQA